MTTHEENVAQTDISWKSESQYTRRNGILIIWSLDNTGFDKFGPLKHVSFSRKFALPTWEQVKLVKERWFGDTEAMMVLPKQEDYVNLHPFTFHLWEIPERWEIK